MPGVTDEGFPTSEIPTQTNPGVCWTEDAHSHAKYLLLKHSFSFFTPQSRQDSINELTEAQLANAATSMDFPQEVRALAQQRRQQLAETRTDDTDDIAAGYDWNSEEGLRTIDSLGVTTNRPLTDAERVRFVNSLTSVQLQSVASASQPFGPALRYAAARRLQGGDLPAPTSADADGASATHARGGH